MKYDLIPNDSRQRYAFQVIEGDANALPTATGIYFLLSYNQANDARLQKIGKANGANGLMPRINDYIHRPVWPLRSTPLFWYRVMTGNVQNNEQKMPEDYGQINVYFRSFAQLQQPIIDPFVNELEIFNIDYDPHAVLENMFIDYAAQLRTTNGNGLVQSNEQYPLLLDSDNRIQSNQFAPP
jgi:hypothetical protein